MYVDDVIHDGNYLNEFAHIKAIMDESFKIRHWQEHKREFYCANANIVLIC